MAKSLRPWIAFFSQTGSEIVELSKALGRWPSLIVTNERPSHLRTIHPELEGRVAFVDNKPTEDELRMVLSIFESPYITLHGWLRIMPENLCNEYEIYNGHPGLILDEYYPELKGKDPVEKIWENREQYKTVGTVIHKVTAGVDEGEVLRYNNKVYRIENKDELYATVKQLSLELWISFLGN